MKAPEWFEKALKKIDPYYRVTWRPNLERWAIVRLTTAPMPGVPDELRMTVHRMMYLVSDRYVRIRETAHTVMIVQGPNKEFLSLDEYGSAVLQMLRFCKAQYANKELGKISEENAERENRSLEREGKEQVQDFKDTWTQWANNKFLDFGAGI